MLATLLYKLTRVRPTHTLYWPHQAPATGQLDTFDLKHTHEPSSNNTINTSDDARTRYSAGLQTCRLCPLPLGLAPGAATNPGR